MAKKREFGYKLGSPRKYFEKIDGNWVEIDTVTVDSSVASTNFVDYDNEAAAFRNHAERRFR